jgi:hypothetical protein
MAVDRGASCRPSRARQLCSGLTFRQSCRRPVGPRGTAKPSPLTTTDSMVPPTAAVSPWPCGLPYTSPTPCWYAVWRRDGRRQKCARSRLSKDGNQHVRDRFCKPICKPDAPGQCETGETRKARKDLRPRVGRGQNSDWRLPETVETPVGRLHNPEVGGSNPPPATRGKGPFSNRERAFRMWVVKRVCARALADTVFCLYRPASL